MGQESFFSFLKMADVTAYRTLMGVTQLRGLLVIQERRGKMLEACLCIRGRDRSEAEAEGLVPRGKRREGELHRDGSAEGGSLRQFAPELFYLLSKTGRRGISQERRWGESDGSGYLFKDFKDETVNLDLTERKLLIDEINLRKKKIGKITKVLIPSPVVGKVPWDINSSFSWDQG